MLRTSVWIGLFLLGGVVCYGLIQLGFISRLGGLPDYQKNPDQSVSAYLTFMSVMLTAVTVVLAAVAIGIGFGAWYTFTEVIRKAEIAAQNRANEVLNERLSEEEIKAFIGKIAFKDAPTNTLGELEADFDSSEKGER